MRARTKDEWSLTELEAAMDDAASSMVLMTSHDIARALCRRQKLRNLALHELTLMGECGTQRSDTMRQNMELQGSGRICEHTLGLDSCRS